MPRIILLLFLTAIAACGADDSWAKVRGLKSGGEMRIYKTGAKLPIIALMDEANDERLVVVVKNEQMAIAREDIDRIDYRPAKSGGRFKKETKTTNANSPEAPTPRSRPDAPESSSSTSLTIQTRPDFETVYRRAPAPLRK